MHLGLKWLTLYLQNNDHSPEDIEASQGRRRVPINLKNRVFEVFHPEAVTWKTPRHQSSSTIWMTQHWLVESLSLWSIHQLCVSVHLLTGHAVIFINKLLLCSEARAVWCQSVSAHTYRSSQTHDDEQEHTPQDVCVQTLLQLAAFVPRPTVVHHGFSLMTWVTQREKSRSQTITLEKRHQQRWKVSIVKLRSRL